MKRTTVGLALCVALAASIVTAQTGTIEIPLRTVDGRFVVPVKTRTGVQVDFVLGLGSTFLTESGRQRIGNVRDGLTLGGIPVQLGAAQVLPDGFSILDGGSTPEGLVGILGSETFNGMDVLIDAAKGRLLLKPAERSVRWPGYTLSNPVKVQVIHDMLIRTDVAMGEKVFAALLDLAGPTMVASPAAASKAGVAPGAVNFKLGYATYPKRRTRVLPLQVFERWGDGGGQGMVLIGAEVARDCVLAVSYVHQEIRTCVQ